MINYRTRTFDQLTTDELWAIYQLRTAVFVVEQNCAYQEVDVNDRVAVHLMGVNDQNELKAYARLIPSAQEHVQIGRVVVAPSARKAGVGRQLVTQAIQTIRHQWPDVQQIDIEAQAYLQDFYASFGFQATSEVYLDTGIPHLDMVLPMKKS
ncbi:GNAT family N-acetyltransferase [Levilactobacillus acidifarinae]|uniref:N-acetyltransferase GCN5 n=1 Tax=Levilactobacillus acidifarinae DSM 19394 = JCM 15949 TaxID=1423715 RepID=A0A0R1LE64_9LACO|nr:GNAT family N-acetyltransferase [Levilactobacillus acidifarinae]KRK94091.1 N-acetyltransferase GCN5 [Levilactobacillus acidifarinae DSM 19394]GEO69741.1 GCN5 family N-acetyltransferase [Levilactobacillus acidifarinae]